MDPVGRRQGEAMSAKLYELIDGQTGARVGTYQTLTRALRARDRRDNEYGAYRYHVRRIEEQTNVAQ